jgi:acyl-CoA thioesterase-1
MHYFISFLLSIFIFNCEAKRIVILGDSLTEGYGVSKENSYPTILENKLKEKFPNLKIINAGTAGATTAIATSSLKWQLKNKPDMVLIALGANDGLRGIKVEATKKNLEKAIKLLQEKNVKVVLVGMKLPFNYGEEYRTSFEKMYSSLSKQYNTLYLPFLLKGVGGIKKYNISDGIHPNEEGHKIVAKTVYDFLINHLE